MFSCRNPQTAPGVVALLCLAALALGACETPEASGCEPACGADSVCISGTCAPFCINDDPCALGQSCQEGVCATDPGVQLHTSPGAASHRLTNGDLELTGSFRTFGGRMTNGSLALEPNLAPPRVP